MITPAVKWLSRWQQHGFAFNAGWPCTRLLPTASALPAVDSSRLFDDAAPCASVDQHVLEAVRAFWMLDVD